MRSPKLDRTCPGIRRYVLTWWRHLSGLGERLVENIERDLGRTANGLLPPSRRRFAWADDACGDRVAVVIGPELYQFEIADNLRTLCAALPVARRAKLELNQGRVCP